MRAAYSLCFATAMALTGGLVIGWWMDTASHHAARVELLNLLRSEEPEEVSRGLDIFTVAWSPRAIAELWRVARLRETDVLRGWPVTGRADTVLIESPSPMVSRLVARDLQLTTADVERGVLLTRLKNKADPIALRLLLTHSTTDGLAGSKACYALATFAARRDEVGKIALERLAVAPLADKPRWARVCALAAYEPAIGALEALLGDSHLSAEERADVDDSLRRLQRVAAERRHHNALWRERGGPNLPSGKISSY